MEVVGQYHQAVCMSDHHHIKVTGTIRQAVDFKRKSRLTKAAKTEAITL